MEGYKTFLILLVSSLLLGLILITFAFVWIFVYAEGLGWDGSNPEFNWHPLLMITGFIFIEGIAIIVYRLPWTWKCSKQFMKFIHASLHLIALVLVAVALVAVFEYHDAKTIPNMYSLHSWVGLTVVILFALQVVVSMIVYLIPITPISIRAALMPVHVYSGLLLFGGVIATALMGITEKLIFSLKSPSYSSLPPPAIFVNTLGLLIVVFGGLVFWIATRPAWKRPPEGINKSSPEGAEVGAASEYSNTEKSDMELNSETARKRNLNLDEAGQRSTM
ncbi:plasma membrane ascorbate-dependent reductase CYBRD1 [Pseudophryne corroboree]|uniref:plasma membrane ascorbate-dependent reductase CYBRD1 n=1 Tax=Pseudophryne corroboree TaxID=495146 RepID=UPI0030821978